MATACFEVRVEQPDICKNGLHEDVWSEWDRRKLKNGRETMPYRQISSAVLSKVTDFIVTEEQHDELTLM